MEDFKKIYEESITSPADGFLLVAEHLGLLIDAGKYNEAFENMKLPAISIIVMKTLIASWVRLGEYTDKRQAFAGEFIRLQRKAGEAGQQNNRGGY